MQMASNSQRGRALVAEAVRRTTDRMRDGLMENGPLSSRKASLVLEQTGIVVARRR
jgi:DNA-directed RNA polymerase specialized sigma54-like protein